MASAEDDVDILLPLAIAAVAGLLDMKEDEMPDTLIAVLHNYGVACHKKGVEYAHSMPTIPHSDPRAHRRRPLTVPSFPPPPPTGFSSIDSDAPTLPPPDYVREALENDNEEQG